MQNPDPLRQIIYDVLVENKINKSDMGIRVILNEIIDRANKEGIYVTWKRQAEVGDPQR